MKPIRSLSVVLALACSQVIGAKDASRIQQLEKDIAVLKRTVVEQSKRIEALERQLPPAASAPSRSPSKQSDSTRRGWNNPASWSRVKYGMSQSQVVSILGQPTSIEDMGSVRTLFYRGEVNGRLVSGNVRLADDRALVVNAPVF